MITKDLIEKSRVNGKVDYLVLMELLDLPKDQIKYVQSLVDKHSLNNS